MFKNKKKTKEEDKRKEILVEDIKRGKALLEMIDNHLLRSKQTRKQRKQFWKEFVSCQNVRSSMYSIIEKSLEGETKYKSKKL